MISKVYVSLCVLAALVSMCGCQLDGSFWWLNQDLKAVALANANAAAASESYKDVEDSITENEESDAISFVDDSGKVQINKESIKKDELINLVGTIHPNTEPFKPRLNDSQNSELKIPDYSKTTPSTARDDSSRNERMIMGGFPSTNSHLGQSKNEKECGKKDCNHGHSTGESGSKITENDECECKTHFDCFSGNGKPSFSKTGTSKCANRVPYMICCIMPRPEATLQTTSGQPELRPDVPSQPIPERGAEAPSQSRTIQPKSFNSGIVFHEDSSIYTGGYNYIHNHRSKRSPNKPELTTIDTSDPYWNIKNKGVEPKPNILRSPKPKIVSETNGYIPDSSTDLCSDSSMKKVLKSAESTSGIRKLPKNWDIQVVSGNEEIPVDDFDRDIAETPFAMKKLQRRHFQVFQEFNPGFQALPATQKSLMTTTRQQKVSISSDGYSDYDIPVPKSSLPKKKFGVPKFGYSAVEPEQDENGDYDSVIVDSISEGDLLYPGCGEINENTNEDTSPGLNDKYSKTHQILSVLFDDEENAVRCTAALIHPRVAIVAAHCISSFRRNNLRIQTPADMQERLVQAIQHPKFNPITRRNDIAILTWRTPLALSPRLRPVCLPTSGDIFPSSSCTTSRFDGVGRRTSVLTKEECDEQFSSSPRRRQRSARQFLCSVLAPTESTCAVPDEENPLICNHSNRWFLAGTPVDLESSPNLYTDASQYTSWIHQVLEDTYII